MRWYTRLIPALLFVIFVFSALFLLSLLVPDAHADGTFYQWMNTSTGTLEFSDSIKAIPAAYKDSAKTRTWGELAASQAKHMTAMQISSAEFAKTIHVPQIAGDESNPNRRNQCDSPATIVSERVQEGEYNRTMYRMVDGCGRTSTFTPSSPHVLMPR
jgi:hypothetical protein